MDCDGCFVLTKTESSHKAIVVVVMLKESDLMSHTVIGAEAFGCFCQPRSILIGLVCVERGWGRALWSTRLKVKCRHGSIEVGIERAGACRIGILGPGKSV